MSILMHVGKELGGMVGVFCLGLVFFFSGCLSSLLVFWCFLVDQRNVGLYSALQNKATLLVSGL